MRNTFFKNQVIYTFHNDASHVDMVCIEMDKQNQRKFRKHWMLKSMMPK